MLTRSDILDLQATLRGAPSTTQSVLSVCRFDTGAVWHGDWLRWCAPGSTRFGSPDKPCHYASVSRCITPDALFRLAPATSVRHKVRPGVIELPRGAIAGSPLFQNTYLLARVCLIRSKRVLEQRYEYICNLDSSIVGQLRQQMKGRE